jgi:hypothetical protein
MDLNLEENLKDFENAFEQDKVQGENMIWNLGTSKKEVTGSNPLMCTWKLC